MEQAHSKVTKFSNISIPNSNIIIINDEITSPTVGSGAAASMRAGSVETLKMKSK